MTTTPEALLATILEAVGEDPAGDAVTIRGEDPIFPNPFHSNDAAAAVIAAGGLAAARFHVDRGGEDQHVTVDVDRSGASMRSRRYLKLEPPLPGDRSGLRQVGRYRTKDDRFILFQRAFAHHRDAQLRVLGCEPNEESIQQAVLQWNALELEDAVVEAGATPGFIRTHAEWDALEHAKVLRSLPLFEIIKIGESDPEPFKVASRPLSDVNVLDVTRVLAGPTNARTLAEHGANVLRVGTDAFPDDPTMMLDTGHGKRSCELDLKSAEGRATLLALVDGADVFAQGYRPGALASLGLSPEDLFARRPGLIYVTLSVFGHEGPWRNRRGFDSVFQAVSGIQDELSSADGPGGLVGNPLDYITGYLAAFGAMVALRRRADEGGSYLVRVSLGQSGTWVNGLGRVDAEKVAAADAELSDERTEEITTTTETPFGRLRHLLPVAQLSVTPTRWDLPTAPLNHDTPTWS